MKLVTFHVPLCNEREFAPKVSEIICSAFPSEPFDRDRTRKDVPYGLRRSDYAPMHLSIVYSHEPAEPARLGTYEPRYSALIVYGAIDDQLPPPIERCPNSAGYQFGELTRCTLLKGHEGDHNG